MYPWPLWASDRGQARPRPFLTEMAVPGPASVPFIRRAHRPPPLETALWREMLPEEAPRSPGPAGMVTRSVTSLTQSAPPTCQGTPCGVWRCQG